LRNKRRACVVVRRIGEHERPAAELGKSTDAAHRAAHRQHRAGRAHIDTACRRLQIKGAIGACRGAGVAQRPARAAEDHFAPRADR
jgi:hypothetical protein